MFRWRFLWAELHSNVKQGKEVLVDNLTKKGISCAPSESLIDLSNKVAAIAVGTSHCPAVISAHNTSNTQTVLTFDKPLSSFDTTINAEAFFIIGDQYWVPNLYQISSIEQTSEYDITFTHQDISNSDGFITICYDTSIGTLEGPSGEVSSFFYTYEGNFSVINIRRKQKFVTTQFSPNRFSLMQMSDTTSVSIGAPISNDINENFSLVSINPGLSIITMSDSLTI